MSVQNMEPVTGGCAICTQYTITDTTTPRTTSFVIMAATSNGVTYFSEQVTIKVLELPIGMPSNPQAPYLNGVSAMALGYLNLTTEVQLSEPIDPDGGPVTFLSTVFSPPIGGDFIKLDTKTRKITIQPTINPSHTGVFNMTIGIVDN